MFCQQIKIFAGLYEGGRQQQGVENEYITLHELAIKVGVTEITIKRRIKELQNKNIIQRKGSKKTGYWEVIEGSYK